MNPLLEAEAIRLFRRYEREIVQDLSLCPWAERARSDGHVREVVLGCRTKDDSAALDAIHRLGEDEVVEIGLLIFPLLEISQPEHERYVSHLVDADAARRPLGTAPFAMAAFHPMAKPDLGAAERLVPFIRRTPDPTIQLVRVSALDALREGFSDGTQFVDVRALSTLHLTVEATLPLRERIARANQKTITKLGVEVMEQRLTAIRADRDRTYSRILADG